MKYAFLALIACYLLVYGCGPDNSKKTEAKKEQAVHNTVEKSAQPAQPMQAASRRKPASNRWQQRLKKPRSRHSKKPPSQCHLPRRSLIKPVNHPR